MKKFLLILEIFMINTLLPYKALTIMPIADLVGQPIGQESLYKSIPFHGIEGAYAWARLHQVLFNEIVEIIEEKGKEVFVEISSAFYETEKDSTKISRFWSLKENFVPLARINDCSKIPTSISFKEKTLNDKNIVTLKLPFLDSKTKINYSVGTRFVKHSETEINFIIYMIDPKTYKYCRKSIPKKLCTRNINNTEKKLKEFISTLKNWIKLKGTTPYVIGGCSLGCPLKKDLFERKKEGKNTFWSRPDYDTTIKNGFDCSNLILRAAQISQIPYFFKNTTTLKKNLKTISPNEKLEAGDLIWVPGHVIVIADLDKNTIIESRSYSHGYGKIQEIPLNEEFKNINTFEDLLKHFFDNKNIKRIDKNKKTIADLKNYKILKLRSIL